ncbi:MAG: hypothetical protein O7H41_13255 [Planctomycetota bacterium]|nr:hypothetical protein [Planctomycetota bacterium]
MSTQERASPGARHVPSITLGLSLATHVRVKLNYVLADMHEVMEAHAISAGLPF